MREIIDLSFSSSLELICMFNDKTIKHINLSEIAKSPVFHFLNDASHTHYVVNRNYFIEWPQYEADLSADTLWHLGTDNKKTPQ
jgi:Protein of unknown function (DUF2442)